MKIQYSYCDGQTINIEVEDNLGEVIIQLERDEYNANRRETRRHESYSNDNDKMDIAGMAGCFSQMERRTEGSRPNALLRVSGKEPNP